MANQITVSGRIKHKHMNTDLLITSARKHFPKLELSDYDFVIPLADCRAQFFCNSTRSLDFRIVPNTSDGVNRASAARAVTAIEMLVRSTDTIWEGMRQALGSRRFWRKPTLDRCVIEDTQSRSVLLVRDSESPLRSAGAKVAYIMTGIFLAVGLALVLWQLKKHQTTDARTANILTITLSLGVAALATPLPILISWREWKKSFTWRYIRIGQRLCQRQSRDILPRFVRCSPRKAGETSSLP